MELFKNVGTAINKAMQNMYGVTNGNDHEKITQLLLKPNNVNLSNYSVYIGNNSFSSLDIPTYYENPFILPSSVMRSMNTYRYVYKTPIILHTGDVQNQTNNKISTTKEYHAFSAVPSMFNPLFSVQVIGMTENVPLLNDSNGIDGGEKGTEENMTPSYKLKNIDPDITNCSIKELVRLSAKKSSILGQERYRYADFMYCKDLGKLANNHLITLRKFATPVGDNISVLTTTEGESNFETNGDVGRLVTWFGTEDNKLEDILKYSVTATWQPLKAEIQELPSKEDDQTRGVAGTVINTLSGANTAGSVNGMGSNKTLWNYLASRAVNGSFLTRFGIHYNENANTENQDLMRNYDQHKIYTPKNTVQDTYIYEGKLTMNQEITLKFCYTLRGYDNINPKSAFLDLIGNILEVTYRRGKFWGGSRKIFGPQKNYPAWKNYERFRQKAADGIQNTLTSILNGTFEIPNILAKGVDFLKTAADAAQKMIGQLKNFASSKSFNDMMKSITGNTLGRPSMYAFNSLLTGDDVGLWHLTVGNPKNPIISMGNLIMTEATIEQGGPLGLDDFPTELTVTVKLKPGRSRDSTEISRMYTKGVGSIYMSSARVPAGKYYGFKDEEDGVAQTIIDTLSKRPNSSSSTSTESIISGLIQNNINNSNLGYSNLIAQQAIKTLNEKIEDSQFRITKDNAITSLTNQSRIKAIQETVDEIA